MNKITGQNRNLYIKVTIRYLLPTSVSIILSVCQFANMFSFPPFLLLLLSHRSLRLSIYLHLSICLSVSLLMFLSIYLSVLLSLSLSMCLCFAIPISV